MVEGVWLHATTPCEFISIDDLRQRLPAGDRVLWQGEVYTESEFLLLCACGAGHLLQPTVQQEAAADEQLWPPTQRVQERLARDIAAWRAQEEQANQRLAEGADPATERKLRERRASAQEMREDDERLLAWIPTAPDLSNNLVMTTMTLEWDKARARRRRRRPWLLLGVALIGVIGYALGRSSR
jgi:hypothetical protein